MIFRVVLITILGLACDPALASWWIVRSTDGKCLVVDVEPMDNDKTVTKLGNDAYQTQEQAETDVKRLCNDSRASRDPGSSEER